MKNLNRKLPKKEHMVNEFIPFSRVFVVSSDGTKLGVVETQKAIILAQSESLDLVVISDKTNPPVARIMDYGKFKYERSKRKKEEKAKQTTIENREVRLSALIGQHDLETKARKAREFIMDGDRVKVSLKFKGREVARKDLGYETLNKFFQLLQDVARIDKEPVLNANRFLDMYLTQDKTKVQKVQPNKGGTDAKNEN